MTEEKTQTSDTVNHPSHYNESPSGVECITVVEHLNFCIGNAMKYLWRAGLKGDAVEDLMKAKWYIDREIQRIRSTWIKPQAKEVKDGRPVCPCGHIDLAHDSVLIAPWCRVCDKACEKIE